MYIEKQGNIYVKNHEIELPKIKKDIDFTLISDLGITHNSLSWNKAIIQLYNNEFNYGDTDRTIFLGDILHSDDDIYNEKVRDIIITIINNSINPIIILGNHENMAGNEKQRWVEYPKKQVIDFFRTNTKATVLDNETYIDEENGTLLCGHNDSFDYYNVNRERQELYIKSIANFIHRNNCSSFDEYAKILLSHAGAKLYGTEYQNYFDATFAAHTHDGLVPIRLQRSNQYSGLYVNGENGIFPKNIRGHLPNSNIIINPALTPLSEIHVGNMIIGQSVSHVKVKKAA